MSKIRFKYLFHGTSSLYRESIEKNGLVPVKGALHLTTHPLVALMEAEWTVNGEHHLKAGYKKGVGGFRLVVCVERAAARNLQIDSPGYYEKEAARERRPSQVRVGFRTSIPIKPKDLSLLDTNLEQRCNQLLDEIERMTIPPPFDKVPIVDFKLRRILMPE
jgi:hypothetical protein